MPGATEIADDDMFGQKGSSMSKANYQSNLEKSKA